MKSIEIMVCMHKPAYIVKNQYLCPIQVGTSISKKILPGILHDNEGINISEKNQMYCELTSQYWAWKHSNAQYVGQCHYRRMLSFSDEEYQNLTEDSRGHVLIPAFTDEIVNKYRLNDEVLIEKAVDQYDIIIPQKQDISKIYTPAGTQKIVIDHWLAHDYALIIRDDLYEMFKLVKKLYPEIYTYMMEYLHGKYFHGFNVFLMRRDLFNAMCEFEFSVLDKLEIYIEKKQYSETYCRQLNRIYGFMGEILSSAYIYYLSKTHPELRIKEVQLLYIEDTEPIDEVNTSSDKTIVLDGWGTPLFMLWPVYRSLLLALDDDNCCNIIILTEDKNKILREKLKTLSQEKKTKLLFVNPAFLCKEVSHLYKFNEFSPLTFLPWLLKTTEKCIYLSWNNIVNKDIFFILNGDADIYGAKNLLESGIFQRKYESAFFQKYKFFEKHNNLTHIESSCVGLNLEMLRKQYTKEIIIKRAKEYYKEKLVNHSLSESFNYVYRDCNISYLSPKYVSYKSSNDYEKSLINDAILADLREYEEYSANAHVESFNFELPWKHIDCSELYVKFWELIDDRFIHNLFTQHNIEVINDNEFNLKGGVRLIFEEMFPKGTGRRESVRKLISGSKLLQHVKHNIIKR